METTNAPEIDRPQHPGFDRVEEILVTVTVRCEDGRTSRLDLAQHDASIITAIITTGGQGWGGDIAMDAQIAANLLDTLPEWFRRELGYAALAAQGETL